MKTITASVTAANTVTVILSNETGGAIDLGSGTLTVKVFKAGSTVVGKNVNFEVLGTNMTTALATRSATIAAVNSLPVTVPSHTTAPPTAVAPEMVIESLTAILCSAKSITNDVEPDVVFKASAKIIFFCVTATVSVSVVLAVILSRVLNSADELFNHSEYEFRLINIARISKIKRFKSLNNLYFTN